MKQRSVLKIGVFRISLSKISIKRKISICAFFLPIFALHIQPVNAQTHLFSDMSRGFCNELSGIVYQQTRDYYIKTMVLENTMLIYASIC